MCSLHQEVEDVASKSIRSVPVLESLDKQGLWA